MTALTPQQKERTKPARARASQIRSGIASYIQTLGVIAIAYQERDWEALGYASWQEYIDGEFPADRLGIPAEYRDKAMQDLRLAGLSSRAIAPVVGVHHSTVARQVSHDATPEATVQGVDGKTYQAKSPIVEALTGAIEDATERIETAGSGGPAPDGEHLSSPSSGTAPEGGLTHPSSGAPDHRDAAPDLGQHSGEAAGVGAPAATAGAGSAPAPAPSSPPVPGPHSAPGAEAEAVVEGDISASPSTACEKCGSGMEPGAADEGFMRCDGCDSEGEHVADDDGKCRLCSGIDALLEAIPAALREMDIVETVHGLAVRHPACDSIIAHLLAGQPLALVLVEANQHPTVCPA